MCRLERGEEVYLGMGQGSAEEGNKASSTLVAENSVRSGRANSLLNSRSGRANGVVNSRSGRANSMVNSRSGRAEGTNSRSLIAASRTFPAVLTVQKI